MQKYGIASYTVSPSTQFKKQKKVLAKCKASHEYGRFSYEQRERKNSLRQKRKKNSQLVTFRQ
jgi:hypothetical protein